MSGKFVGLNTWMLFQNEHWKKDFIEKHITTKDTYFLIFAPHQSSLKEWFLENFNGRILYVSPDAYCDLHRGRMKGNVVVVFEFVDGAAPLDAMSAKKEEVYPLAF